MQVYQELTFLVGRNAKKHSLKLESHIFPAFLAAIIFNTPHIQNWLALPTNFCKWNFDMHLTDPPSNQTPNHTISQQASLTDNPKVIFEIVNNI